MNIYQSLVGCGTNQETADSKRISPQVNRNEYLQPHIPRLSPFVRQLFAQVFNYDMFCRVYGVKSSDFIRTRRFFLVASSNATKVLEFAEQASDDMAFLVHVPVTFSLHFAGGLRRYYYLGVTLSKLIKQGISVIPFVGQQCICFANILHWVNRLGDARCLSSRQNETHGQAQHIGECVNIVQLKPLRERPSASAVAWRLAALAARA